MSKLRIEGPKVTGIIAKNELANPRLAVTHFIRSILFFLKLRFSTKYKTSKHDKVSKDSLIFFYDLEVSPITFDFVSCLAGAVIEARTLGLKKVFVVIVPYGDKQMRGQSPDYESFINKDGRAWRVRNIILPAISMFPEVGGFACLTTRDQAISYFPQYGVRIFPKTYLLDLPCQPNHRLIQDNKLSGENVWPLMRPTPLATEYVKEYLQRITNGRRPVVISLRSSDYAKGRNSNIAAWTEFASKLDTKIYSPIFITDQQRGIEHSAQELAGFNVCTEASWNLEIRMALYTAAFVNLAISHGPMELCWYNSGASYLLFMSPDKDETISSDSYALSKFSIGKDFTFAAPQQHLIWADDTEENISVAFNKFINSQLKN
jgi:hypothetical protein